MEFSNQYLTYEEYQSLGGNLAEMPFNLLEFKARGKVNDLTFGRLKHLDNQIQEVKLCIYDLISEMENFDNNSSNTSNKNKGNIASEKVGDWSATYLSTSLSNEQKITLNKEQNTKYNSIINSYLSECKLCDGTPYLYRG